jgi:hypothetical protein
MAQRVTATLEDDLDGGPADETVRFGFGGAEYEIEVCWVTARRTSEGGVRAAPGNGSALAAPVSFFAPGMPGPALSRGQHATQFGYLTADS